jgi:hypothetical protein
VGEWGKNLRGWRGLVRTYSPSNHSRRTNAGAAPSPLHLALSLIEGEDADIRNICRHPSDPCDGGFSSFYGSPLSISLPSLKKGD